MDYTVSSITANFVAFLCARVIDEVFGPDDSNTNAAVYCLITRKIKKEKERKKRQARRERKLETKCKREQQEYVLFLN